MKESRLLLKQQQLHVTVARIAILDMFLQSKEALSFREIEKGVLHDRSTIYRTIQLLLQKKLIESVPTTGDTPLFIYRCSMANQIRENQPATFFKCYHCCKTYSMDEVVISLYKIPKGYSPSITVINMHGVCENCKSDSSCYLSAS